MNEHKTADDIVQLARAHAKLVIDALNDMRQERDEAKASLHNVCKDRDFVMEQLSMTRNERDALRQENKSFAASFKDTEAKLVDLRSKLSHQCDENEALRKTLLAISQERDDLRTAAKALAEKRDSLQSYVDEVVTARNTFNRQPQEMSIERTNLRNEKLDLKTTVHALRKLNSNQTDTILKLQTQHENQRATILELQKSATDPTAWQQRAETLDAQLLQSQHVTDTLRKQLNALLAVNPKPTQQEYLRHELMDRASIMSNIFEAMIIDHPAIDPDKACFSTAVHNTLSDKINAAADALNDVYQFIGDKHL